MINEKDIIEFANDLLKQIKYFGYLQREEKKQNSGIGTDFFHGDFVWFIDRL